MASPKPKRQPVRVWAKALTPEENAAIAATCERFISEVAHSGEDDHSFRHMTTTRSDQ